jgi:hypothetical protein
LGAFAKLLADDDAGGDGIDVLERAADLGAGHVIAPITAERGMTEGMRKSASMRFARGGKGQGGGKSARDLGREART